MADQLFNVNCGFFDAIDHDRTYSADDMNKPYSRVVSDGVFATKAGTPSTDLQVVSADNGMEITVREGQAIVASKWFESPTAVSITVPANTEINPRIDSVIIQVDKRASGRMGSIVYRTGTPGATPVPPEINTIPNVIEYRVANIRVVSNVTIISDYDITDTRGSEECPWITGLIQQVDTSELFRQWQAAYQKYFDSATEDFEDYVETQRAAWEAFIESLTQELDVSMNIISFTSEYNATGTVTNIPIGILSFDPDTDVLQVYINGLSAVGKYELNADKVSIDLDNAINNGDSVYFVVFKSVIGGDIDTTVTLIQMLDAKLDSYMADSGWINLALDNGAQPYTGMTPAVRSIGSRVFIRGAFTGVAYDDTVVCTLPSHYRPAADHIFTTVALDSENIYRATVVIKIAANGEVVLLAKSNALSGVWFIPIATCYLSAFGTPAAVIYTYKGSVQTYSALPASGMKAGDVYTVETADAQHGIAAGDKVMWDGSGWEVMNGYATEAYVDSTVNTAIGSAIGGSY